MQNIFLMFKKNAITRLISNQIINNDSFKPLKNKGQRQKNNNNNLLR